MQIQENAPRVEQASTVNILNHIHFTGGHVLVLLRHPRFEESILLKAYPDPCLGNGLFCRWAGDHNMDLSFIHYQFLGLIVDDGLSMILVPAVAREMSEEGVFVEIPEVSHAVGQRQVRRHRSHEVEAELIQSGFLARGELTDFSPAGFRLRVKAEPSCSFHWFNAVEPFTVHLRRNGKMLYSGRCEYLRGVCAGQEGEIVVKPVNGTFCRFGKRQVRNTRLKLLPTPTLSFVHPLLGKRVRIQVDNISSSGFSVCEGSEERLLVPGMIIPDMTVSIGGTANMACDAQVIYHVQGENGETRYGVAILDMDIQDYSRLTHLLSNALDPHAHIADEVDMDALWEFFFTSGFVYPKKYRLIQAHREDFRRTYERLYLENPEIARHFTYERNGRIYGHISMVRAYEKAWMIHHHAAHPMDSRRTGFLVLKQIMHYLNDMHRLPSANMDYAMSYFRPENKFPERVFGGFAKELENPKGCSTDLFCYLPYTGLSVGTQLPDEWTLEPCSPFHLWELNRFYDHCSGGLLLDALGLNQTGGPPNEGNLKKVYEQLGFKRSWEVFSLSHRGELHAVLIANQSDLGFNLSELLNGIKVLVTNPGGLPWNVLSTAISMLAGRYPAGKIPVLFFPAAYVDQRGIPYEKRYQMWILNVRFGNEYMEYVQRRFRMSHR